MLAAGFGTIQAAQDGYNAAMGSADVTAALWLARILIG
jgi:hypothetical protein